MLTTTENIKSMIQDIYAEVLSFEELFEIHAIIRSECDKQSVLTAKEIANRANNERDDNEI